MKKKKIICICIVLLLLCCIINVQAGKLNNKTRSGGSKYYGGIDGYRRYNRRCSIVRSGILNGVLLEPWYCWTVAFGLYTSKSIKFTGSQYIELYGARFGDLCFGTGEGNRHELSSYWNVSVYYDDGVVIHDQLLPNHHWWDMPLLDDPDFVCYDIWTNPYLYTITRIDLHEDKYIDGEHYEYSNTIWASDNMI